jgi:hypothetical protein
MIPNAVASTGPYAGLWSHLKSIDHALGRTLASADPRKLTELDRDRLQALVDFLQSSLLTDSDPLNAPGGQFLPCQTLEPDYSRAIDLREELDRIPAFKEWSRPSRKPIENSIQRLIRAVEEVLVGGTPEQLFPEIRKKELGVLRAVVQSLLAETEIAMY